MSAFERPNIRSPSDDASVGSLLCKPAVNVQRPAGMNPLASGSWNLPRYSEIFSMGRWNLIQIIP